MTIYSFITVIYVELNLKFDNYLLKFTIVSHNLIKQTIAI